MTTRACLAVTVLLALGLAAGPAPAQEAIKIGFFAPLTGFAAVDGASTKHSAEIAVEELNAAGGIKGRKIELVVYDDRHDSKEAVAVANKLVEKDQVVGVVSGSYSMPSRVAAPIFAKAGLPMTVAYAVHPDVTKAGPCVFRNGYLGQVEGWAGAEAAVKLHKARRIAALTVDNDFGRVSGAAFIDMVGASAYDAVKILAQAIDAAGTDPKAICAALTNLRDYPAFTGKITRFTKGEVTKPVQVQVIRDGKIHSFATIDNPEVITPPVQ